ncbi:MAG: FecR family protein [Oceanibaculum nanhaiense]|jgi:transmembrane sensor|uniref:FecR family protein n=1 Tax=Oceanibaculum nanhaiense TaxID=1909734 RepID=UPI0032EED620
MTTTTPSSSGDIDPAILNEAAGWLVLLHSSEASARDLQDLERWRARSAAHEAAWQRAENMLGAFRQVPPKLGRDTLARLGSPGRRQLLRLGLLAIAAPSAGWLGWHHLPWREWSADLRTATGEQKRFDLADGTRLVLNTASAVDIVFSPTERRLTLLAGEILITTAKDASPTGPRFILRTGQGSLSPLGTRFAVRQFEESTRLAVFEGAVEIRPAASGQAAILRAGEQTDFTTIAIQPPAPAEDALWERGMLLARDMPLGTLVAELARYHRGLLRCGPEVAGLTVSGAFPVTDVPTSLTLLEKTLPVRVGRATGYWLTVRAR